MHRLATMCCRWPGRFRQAPAPDRAPSMRGQPLPPAHTFCRSCASACRASQFWNTTSPPGSTVGGAASARITAPCTRTSTLSATISIPCSGHSSLRRRQARRAQHAAAGSADGPHRRAGAPLTKEGLVRGAGCGQHLTPWPLPPQASIPGHQPHVPSRPRRTCWHPAGRAP